MTVRPYDTWQHVAECLDWLELYSQSAPLSGSDTSLLQYALFYHDLVYHPSTTDNELESARVAADTDPARDNIAFALAQFYSS